MNTSIILAILLAQNNATQPSYFDRPGCSHPEGDTFFFVEGSLCKTDFESCLQTGGDAFTRKWYSSHLRTMAEPSLSCRETRSAATYRFLWLRTFHNPIAVRVERTKEGANLSAVVLSGAGGYDPGKIQKRVEKKLSESDWNVLSAAIEKDGFWKSPALSSTRDLGLDGSQWILEGRTSDKYRVIDRWSPKSGSFREICTTMLKFAGLFDSSASTQPAFY